MAETSGWRVAALSVLSQVALVLGGCANLRPSLPDMVMKPFEIQYESTLGADSANASLPAVRSALSTFSSDLLVQLKSQNEVAWNFSDLTFFGVVATVAGTAADKIGLRNTGAGAATLGVATPAHYQVEPTFQAYLKAMKRLACVQSRVADLPLGLGMTLSDIQATAANADDLKEVLAAYQGMQSTIYAAVNALRTDLATSILTSRPTEASTTDFSATLTKFKTASLTAGEANVPKTGANLVLVARRNKANVNLQAAQQAAAAEQQQVAVASLRRSRLERESNAEAAKLATHQGEVATLMSIKPGDPNLPSDPRYVELMRKQKTLEDRAELAATSYSDSVLQETLASRRAAAAEQAVVDATNVRNNAMAATAEDISRAQTLAMEQIKGLAAALALCTAL